MINKILVITNTIDAGGAETFVMKLFRCIDRSQYIFDFLINKRESNFYLKEINNLGGSVFYGYSKSRDPFKSFYSIYKIVKSNQYKIIFCIAVHPIGFIDILAARLGGASKILTRSTTTATRFKLSLLLAFISRPFMNLLTTVRIAPSKEAGEWLFGKSEIRKDNVCILTNGIDVQQYIFSQERRTLMRRKLNIPKDMFVVGHVGRLCNQKNHAKILNVFAEIKKEKQNSILLLVGVGELEAEIKEKTEKFGLNDSVILLGTRNDIPDLLMAFDVMVFPSFYEGLPNSIIEAQATSLPCIISDTISKEVKITDRVVALSLDKSDSYWAKVVLDKSTEERKDMCKEITEAGFSIYDTTNRLLDILKEYNNR